MFFGRNENSSKLNGVSSITNRKVIIYSKDTETAESYPFESHEHPLERDIYFDQKGQNRKIGKSRGEGLLFYYRNPSKFQLRLSDEDLNFKLKIHSINHLIIENTDTIKSFEVNFK